MRRLAILAAVLVTVSLGADICLGATAPLEAAERYARYFDFRSLVSGGSVQPHWMADGHRFWFVDGAPDQTAVYRVDTDAGTKEPFFDVDRLRAALREVLGEEPPGQGIPFSTFELNDDETSASFVVADREFEFDLSSYALTETATAEEPASERAPSDDAELPAPEGDWIAVIRDANVWLETADGKESIQVTDDGTEDLVWTTYGASWSPDGAHLAVTRYDLEGVHRIPIVDWLDPAEPVTRDPYPRCQDAWAQPAIHLIDAATKSLTRVRTDPEAEDLLQSVGWHPETGELFVLRLNRIMSEQDLLAADPRTGETRVLVSERSDTFIDGLAAAFLMDHYHHPVGDGEHFVWTSERSGFLHLYLYRYDGTLVRPLTGGAFPVVQVVEVDHENRWVYFTGQSDLDHPYDRHLCRVDLDGGRFQQLTEGTGRHDVILSPDKTHFVDNHSDVERPPTSQLRRVDGTMVTELAEADVSALQDLGWRAPERAVVKAADGETDLHTILYFPPEFDPTRRYPVIEVIYAGPQWPIVPRRFVAGEYGDTAAALAQLGYVTVIIDGRGTRGRGKAFQDVVFGRLGQVEIPDHVAALRQLAATRPYLDLERVGVHGKSWGGYFALRAMLVAPEMYKVGVASALVADLRTTAESPVVPYLGLPADNPDGYESADCITLADRLEGELLITIGTADGNTPFGESMRMMRAFVEAGKDVDILVLPGEHHWLQGPSFARWQRAMRDYFLEHLPLEVVSAAATP